MGVGSGRYCRDVGLFKTRRAQAELEAREAAGESFWTSQFDEGARNKIVLSMTGLMDALPYGVYPDQAWAAAELTLCEDLGLLRLGESGNPQRNVVAWVLDKDHPADVATVIEGFMQGAVRALRAAFNFPDYKIIAVFEERLNAIFRDHRISFDLTGGEMIPFESKEMHSAVVAPTLRLLSQSPGDWVDVESAYQDALREISEDNPADAITDAGRALQAALEASGAKGNALGPLIKDAKKQGLLGPHDTNLTNGIESLMHWVSAERSEMGEAHKAGTDQRADAWLAVHVVGALILRLAEGPRSQGTE